MSASQKNNNKPAHPGVILAELIKIMGITQGELAKRIGVHQTSLSQIACGKVGLSPTMIVKIAKATKTSPLYWLMAEYNHTNWSK